MAEVRGIIIVPADGDPHGLLEGGVGGYRPPMAYQSQVPPTAGRWTLASGTDHDHLRDDYVRGLVLAWHGRVVLPGCAHLNAWMTGLESSVLELGTMHLGRLHRHSRDMARLVRLARYKLVELGRFTTATPAPVLVLVDAQGREITRGGGG